MAKAVIPEGFVFEAKKTKTTIPTGFVLDKTPQQSAPTGFSFTETIKNIPESAVQLGKNLIQPVLHPIETAKSLQTVGQGLVEKLIPDTIGGVDFGPTENEQTADQVGEFIKGRYGSVENLLNTVETDPVGITFDIAGLLTGGSALIPKVGKLATVSKAVETVGKAIDPINTAINAVKMSGRLIPARLPEKLLETALKLPTRLSNQVRSKMAQTALREGILPTVGGLERISTKLSALDTSLNNIIDVATKSGATIPKQVLFGHLKQLRQQLGGAKLDAATDLRTITSVAKSFSQQLSKLKKSKLTPREVQTLKTDAYKRINFDLAQGRASFAKNETRRAIAKSARKSLEKIDPDIQPLNRAMGDLINLRKEMEKVVSRLDNRNIISLDTAAKVAVGTTAGGGAGALVGLGASALGAPRIKARTALILHNIKINADAAHLLDGKLTPALARQLSIQSGRIDQALKEELKIQLNSK